jgi:outer membrane protein TolC
MKDQIVEAESKIHAAESERLQAQAQLAAARSTYERLKKASETAGAIAGNSFKRKSKWMRPKLLSNRDNRRARRLKLP